METVGGTEHLFGTAVQMLEAVKPEIRANGSIETGDVGLKIGFVPKNGKTGFQILITNR